MEPDINQAVFTKVNCVSQRRRRKRTKLRESGSFYAYFRQHSDSCIEMNYFTLMTVCSLGPC